MKIHSDTLTERQIYAATAAAGMHGVEITEFRTGGSRSRKRRFEVYLSGNSRHWTNSGTRGQGGNYAATWDEWGMFINALFQRDPNAIIGQYPSFEAFHDFTRGRFDELTAPYSHGDHRWEFNREAMVMQCTLCEAEQDNLALHKWQVASKVKRQTGGVK